MLGVAAEGGLQLGRIERVQEGAQRVDGGGAAEAGVEGGVEPLAMHADEQADAAGGGGGGRARPGAGKAQGGGGGAAGPAAAGGGGPGPGGRAGGGTAHQHLPGGGVG